MALGAPGCWGRGSPSSAWRWYKSQRTFSLAQSAGVCSGSHRGRGGGQRPLRPRGTPPSAGSGWPHAGDPAWTWKRGPSRRALVPRPAARLLAHAAGAPPLRRASVSSGLWLPRATPTSRPLPRHCWLLTSGRSQPPGGEPLPWGALGEVFPGPLSVFTSFLLLCGSWECGGWTVETSRPGG